MTRKAYLAFDLGAESGRAMLGVMDGGQLSLHEMHRFANTMALLPDGYHWNTVGLWQHLVEGLGKAVDHAKANDLEIASLGVDTWGVDFGLLGESGELLGIPFAYRDTRNKPAKDEALKQLGEARLYGETGIQFMALNTIFQLVAWRHSEPAVLDQAAHLLFTPDLLHYFFSGQKVNEYSIASTSAMINPKTGDWCAGLLGELGLPTKMLGRIVPAGTQVGALREAVRQETGAAAGVKVIAPASHDTASAVAAVPVAGDRPWVYLSSGTWSLMGVELNEPNTSDAALKAQFTNEGGVNRTTRFLKNISGLWLVQEVRRAFAAEAREYDYAELTRLAGEAEAFRTLVDPDHEPFGSPGGMPDKLRDFARSTGQPEPQDAGQLVRCCLESLALTYRRTLNNLQKVLGRKSQVIHIVGGGARNELLNQMTADACGLPVVAGPFEATAIGNVLVQAMGGGDVKDLAEIRRVVTASYRPKTFEPTDTARWDEADQRYLKLR